MYPYSLASKSLQRIYMGVYVFYETVRKEVLKSSFCFNSLCRKGSVYLSCFALFIIVPSCSKTDVAWFEEYHTFVR